MIVILDNDGEIHWDFLKECLEYINILKSNY
jgi:hypothetical protein